MLAVSLIGLWLGREKDCEWHTRARREELDERVKLVRMLQQLHREKTSERERTRARERE